MYKCKYFKIKELVNPELLKTIPENTLWSMFDDRLLKCADLIREKYGVCTVNSGSWVDCGFRAIDSKNGAKWSAHKFGRALDLHIRSIELQYQGKKSAKTAQYNRVREQLLAEDRFDCLNFENDISWLHIDTYNRANRVFLP